MRCPKCHYISFEAADRCRNCGYELSLGSAVPRDETELTLNDRGEDPMPPVDLSLSGSEGAAAPRDADRLQAASSFDIDQMGSPASLDLPLFKGATASRHATNARHESVDPDAPLIKPSAVPRPPIAVRRPTPDVQRLRSRYSVAEAPRLDLEPDIEAFHDEGVAPPMAGPAAPAPALRRIVAAIVDALIVNGINLAVLYFTLKLCDLPLSLAGVLEIPVVPLAGFLLLVDGGYFVTFTAVVGQTIGKMATGLRVVHVSEDGEDHDQPNIGFSILRTAAYGASILPAGLGFLPALLGKDGRALHDRLAETRVVFSGKLRV
jgi:uncharacterized RDD family membrane protein YckC